MPENATPTRKNKGGRPPKPNGPDYPARVAAPITVEMHQRLAAACAARDISIGDAVRESLALWLDRQPA